jgi:hypothetical protein
MDTYYNYYVKFAFAQTGNIAYSHHPARNPDEALSMFPKCYEFIVLGVVNRGIIL